MSIYWDAWIVHEVDTVPFREFPTLINGESFPSSNVFSFLHTSSSYACARISRISVQCLPGKRGVAARQSNDTCVDCVEGTYNDKPGQASCIACDPGKVTDGRVGQTFCSACAAGTKHQPGDSSCTPCQLGKFTNKSGQISCTSCDSGKITNGMGQTFCSICDAGQFCTIGALKLQSKALTPPHLIALF